MAETLPSVNDCCTPCSGTATVQVPGPTGTTGSSGSDGTDGVNAHTTTTADFDMPAEAATVVVNVSDSTWMTTNQVLYLTTAGYMQVSAKPTTTSVTLLNLEDTANSLYTDNAAPTTVIVSGASVSPAGIQGPAGVDSSGVSNTVDFVTVTDQTGSGLASSQFLDTKGTGVVIFDDTSDIVSTQTVGVSDDNIVEVDDAAGLTSGEIIQATANGIESVTPATGRTSLGLGTSAVVDTGVADNQVVTVDQAAGLTTGEAVYATANGLETRSSGSSSSVGYGLLGKVLGVDVNSVGDNSISVSASSFILDKAVAVFASGDPSAGQMEIRNASGGGGVALFSNTTLTDATASGKYQGLTLNASTTDSDVYSVNTIYGRVTFSDNGTVDIYVYGWILS